MRDERSAIDDINVFPVADGDTGTNLYFTLLSAHRAVERLPHEAALHEVLSAMARGALRGARGNSGLILSVALQGCADAWEGIAVADAGALASALELAAARARRAVAAPVDGTMLSIMDAIAREARARAGAGLEEQIHAVHRAARDALARTPEQLSVLSASGVVDAGGMGVLELVDALYVIGTGTMPPARTGLLQPVSRPEPLPLQVGSGDEPPAATARAPMAGAAGEGQTALEIVADLMAMPDEDAYRALRERLGALGADSLVLSPLSPPALGAARLHLHLPGEAPARQALAILAAPAPLTALRMERLGRGREHGLPGAAGAAGSGEEGPLVVAFAKETSLAMLFALGGALAIPLDPAADTVPAHLDALLAEHPERPLIVLPNHRAALQRARTHLRSLPRTAHAHLHLVRSRAAVQGLSALAVHDPAAEAADLAEDMTETAAATRTGAVRRATYAGSSPAGEVAIGDYLARIDGRTRLVSDRLLPVARGLLDRLLGAGGELITLVTGAELPPGVVPELRSWLAQHHPETEISVLDGHQSADLLLVGVE
nr:DAK2 domain-containing protein [Sediminivirga luteola]